MPASIHESAETLLLYFLIGTILTIGLNGATLCAAIWSTRRSFKLWVIIVILLTMSSLTNCFIRLATAWIWLAKSLADEVPISVTFPPLYGAIPMIDAFSNVMIHLVYAYCFAQLFPPSTTLISSICTTGALGQIASASYELLRVINTDYGLADPSRVAVLIPLPVTILGSDVVILVGILLSWLIIKPNPDKENEDRIPFWILGCLGFIMCLSVANLTSICVRSNMLFIIFGAIDLPLRILLFLAFFCSHSSLQTRSRQFIRIAGRRLSLVNHPRELPRVVSKRITNGDLELSFGSDVYLTPGNLRAPRSRLSYYTVNPISEFAGYVEADDPLAGPSCLPFSNTEEERDEAAGVLKIVERRRTISRWSELLQKDLDSIAITPRALSDINSYRDDEQVSFTITDSSDGDASTIQPVPRSDPILGEVQVSGPGQSPRPGQPVLRSSSCEQRPSLQIREKASFHSISGDISDTSSSTVHGSETPRPRSIVELKETGDG